MADTTVIGVDLGGTKILAGVIGSDGTVYRTIEHPTPTESETALLDGIEAAVRELLTPEIAAVGFGIPSRIDHHTGLALGAVNIPLRNLPFHDELAARLGVPIGAENDASVAALAEFTLGAGRGATDMVMLTLGTGVGGGVVIDGKLYRGWTELGHIVIVEDGEPCYGACSGRGHLEAYCSGYAADRVAREVLRPDATARDLVMQQHPALEEIGHHLGTAIGSLINVFGPQVFVIGGGFGIAAGELLLERARSIFQRDALDPGQNTRLVLAELGTEAGLIGAGLIAFEALEAG